MKGLRKIVDNVKPTFSEGGKLGFLASFFDAIETFLFVPNTTTKKGAHIRDCNDLKRTMTMVILALLPAFLFGCFNTGIQVGLEGFAALIYGLVRVLPMVAVSYIVGLGIEIVYAQIRKEEVAEGYLVTGLLIPMIMPVSTPLWMVALGVAFSVIFGKEVFGGTGMNIFNPALVARAFVFFAFTPQMSGEKVWFSDWKMMGAADATTGATTGDGFSTGTGASEGFSSLSGAGDTAGATSTGAVGAGVAAAAFFWAAIWACSSAIVGCLAAGAGVVELIEVGV